MRTLEVPAHPLARNVSEPEIDALLARPEEPRPSVVARDFREPRRLSAADLEALRRPLESASAAVLDAVRLVVPIEIALEPIEIGETSLDAVLRDDGTDVVGAVCEGASGPSIVTLDARSAVAIAEIALGADENESPEARAMTPLEKTLVDRLLVRVLERATQSLQLAAKETRAFASRALLAREVGTDGDRRRVALRIPLTIGPTRAVIHVLLAGVKVPAPKGAPAAPASKDAKKPALPAEIAPTIVDLCAVLARTDILLTELLALEPGDVITLDAAPGQTIVIEIEGQPRARARFGARDARMAVRIQEILRNPSPR
jgi:flagellar motor switch protein FliM